MEPASLPPRPPTRPNATTTTPDDFLQQLRRFAGSSDCGDVTSLLACAHGVPLLRGVTTMGWFRSRSKWGSCLALLALALQLALSFGHVHVGLVSKHSSASIVAISTDAHKPAGRQPHLPAAADHNCPVCALIHLAGTLLPSAPPALALPAISGRLPHEIVAQFDLSATPSAHFQARGPPLA